MLSEKAAKNRFTGEAGVAARRRSPVNRTLPEPGGTPVNAGQLP
jgi:hypothetical protein